MIYKNVRVNRRGNQEWIIQRKLQHCVQKTQDDDRQSTTQTKKKSNTNVNKNRGAHRHPQR